MAFVKQRGPENPGVLPPETGAADRNSKRGFNKPRAYAENSVPG